VERLLGECCDHVLIIRLNDPVAELVERASRRDRCRNLRVAGVSRMADPAGGVDHYTPTGGTVIIILERDDHSALVRVQDTGIGIAPAEQARIFDRFYRVHSDRSRHTGGVGLGLAIVTAIVRSHQGDIKVQSELGKGSTFIVRLPLRIPSRNG
jgi:nitrogen-specific signal transduction histidine kinase